MRKRTLLAVLCFLFCMLLPMAALADVAIDKTNFPDDSFRKYIKDTWDINNNNKLSDAELALATWISCENKGIKDLKGIEHFTSLVTLKCSGNQLTKLDLSNNKILAALYCSNNNLTSLNLDNNTATSLTLRCEPNNYPISVRSDGKFDLRTLPGNFDVNRTKDWKNGSVSGNTLTVKPDASKVTYKYKCKDYSILSDIFKTFTLNITWRYTITFDTDGGSAVSPITQDYGTAITAPAAPTKTGYTFAGWKPSIPATMPAENMTIKAQWTADKPAEKYTLTFDTDGGSEIAPITAEAGTAITAPAAPTKTGYTFAGWDKPIPEKMPAENMTIKAQWTADKPTEKYTVSVTGSYATPNGEGAYAAGETVSLDAGTLTGYDFEGWTVTAGNAKLKDAKQAKTTFVMPDNAVAVTANWKQQKSFVQPQTGDNSRVLLWGATLAGCAAALVCMKKKKK